ncbi:unnamed protein product, partial [Staurois parvus]
MTCRPCHLDTPSGSSPVIGPRNCSSGEAHRRPITGEEVELGEEEPSGHREDRAGEEEESGRRKKTADRGRERAQAGAGVSKVSI